MDSESYGEELIWKAKAVAAICPLSCLFFTAVNILVKSHFTPQKCATFPGRWRMFVTSWVHAVICAVAALTIILTEEEWMGDSDRGFYLHLMSSGYFIYDTVFKYTSSEKLGSFEMYAHHILSIFFITVSQFPPCGRISTYSPWDYLCEVANVFLHGRKIIVMLGLRESVLYKWLTVLFFASFTVFRFIPQILVFVMMNVDYWSTSRLSLFCYLIAIPQQLLLVVIGTHVAYNIIRRSALYARKVAPHDNSEKKMHKTAQKRNQ
ncbi:TLC domain-containing protein 2-like [Lingula anatina]|uniref:TLC domain-containing protein 2-like n=1 Tax=Lingula anatina TaxID=7574 RepID=A0A1S3IB67_LINAN|nr:TLC domain-containing protein 2-like [Lingula anatina]|eukprot:XP_013395096.1 TLC domain-containing protein 2-like [Lingula anatina]